MNQLEIDIADMQCWIFRMAQTKWNLLPNECALDDIEEMLHNNGVSL